LEKSWSGLSSLPSDMAVDAGFWLCFAFDSRGWPRQRALNPDF